MIIYYDTEEQKYYTYEAMKEVYSEMAYGMSFYQWLSVSCSKNGSMEKIYVNDVERGPMTAEELLIAYVENTYGTVKDHHILDIVTSLEPETGYLDNTVWAFAICQKDNTKKGFIQIYSANKECGITCHDEQISIDDIENVKLYYDYDKEEFTNENTLIESYCNQVKDGTERSLSYNEWLEHLENDNIMKRIL